jgi:hypothetical protein
MFPDLILTTDQIGRTMLAVVRKGSPGRVLESRDIGSVAPVEQA